MVKWYMASKVADGSEIYWDGRHYDAFNAPAQDDFKFYLAQAKKARGPVLELACGTGRLTIPLKKEGIAITGLDLAAPMLERAETKAAEAGVKIPFLRCAEVNVSCSCRCPACRSRTGGKSGLGKGQQPAQH